jgi:hypothetical protein
MSNLLTRTRRLIDDQDMTIWSDDELQDILDEHKVRVHRERLEMEKTLVSASDYEYKNYHSRHSNYEEGGTAYFHVEAANGTQRGTADYSVNYVRGYITMTADQAGSALYLSGWSYDLNAGAADCWRERAGTKAGQFDAAMDGHKMTRSQWFTHCVDMAKMYERRSQPVTVRPWREGDFDQL